MNKIQMIYSVMIIIYLSGMILLGIRMSKKIKSSSNYYTGGRDMNAAVTGFSFSSTQMSSGSIIGVSSTTYSLGYNYGPASLSTPSAPWFSYVMIGERMRKIAERIDAMDYGDIFGVRYGKASKLLYALVILIFYIPLIIAQFTAAGNILESLTGLPYMAGVVIIGGVILVYTLFGGMYSVAWSDYIQGIVMMIGVGGLAGICLHQVGGFAQMNEGLSAIDPNLLHSTGLVTATWAVCNFFTWSFLQIGGSTAAIVRFLIPKDVKTLRNAFGYSMGFTLFVSISVLIIGLCGRQLVPNLSKPDQIIPVLIGQYMNPFIGGILISGIISAMMSTVDSVLLLCSSVATRNIYLSFINPDATAETQLKLGKITTIVIGIIAILMAFKPFAAIQWMVAFSFNVFAAAFTVPILFAAWWQRASKVGGLCGMITGVTVSLIWYAIGYNLYGSFSNWLWGIWPAVIGVASSLLVTVVVSLMTRPPEQKIIDTFYLE